MKILVRLLITILIFYVYGYGFVVLKNIWTKELDWRKTLPNPFVFIHFKKEFVPPNPSYELRYTKENYQQGLEVHGLCWEKDFLMYEFTFLNKSKMASMEDVRLKFEIPGVFVKHIITRQEGIENINLSSEKDYLRKVNPKTKTIIDTIDTRSNVFTVNISRAHPHSFVAFKFIFQGGASTDVPSYFTIKYRFKDQDGEQQMQKIHPIIVNDHNDWRIDSLSEIDKTKMTQHAISIVPIAPVSSKAENKAEDSIVSKNKIERPYISIRPDKIEFSEWTKQEKEDDPEVTKRTDKIHLYFRVKNSSDFPAVNVDISATGSPIIEKDVGRITPVDFKSSYQHNLHLIANRDYGRQPFVLALDKKAVNYFKKGIIKVKLIVRVVYTGLSGDKKYWTEGAFLYSPMLKNCAEEIYSKGI